MWNVSQAKVKCGYWDSVIISVNRMEVYLWHTCIVNKYSVLYDVNIAVTKFGFNKSFNEKNILWHHARRTKTCANQALFYWPSC